MKHDTFLILNLLIKFLKELVVGQGLFSAKSPCLFLLHVCTRLCSNCITFDRPDKEGTTKRCPLD